MIAQNDKKKARRTTPVTDTDRRRLLEIHDAMLSWSRVSEALGFRGGGTARRWALEEGATFKGSGYPDRIRALHEQVVGPGDELDRRLREVEQKVAELLQLLYD